ncbi:MAG: ROK family glucokinase [Lachnospiraceae bacterium]
MNYCFGVDIGGTTVKIGLFEFNGQLIDRWEIKTRTENEGMSIIPDIVESIEQKLQEKQIEKNRILGIGVGVPAPVSKEGIVRGSANLGWKYKEVRHEIEEATRLHVSVGNDANIAALGEMWKGGGYGNLNLIMVTLGTGVGGGIIVNGRVLSGANGAGGEIGHMCVNYKEQEACGCGKKGCLEQYASATGIVRLAKRKLAATSRPSILLPLDLSAKSVFDAVKAGDEVAKEIAEEFGTYLGYALANIAVLADPATIVIGGGVSKAGEIILPYIEKKYQEYAFNSNKDVRFSLAELGNDAGIYGAAKMILN